MSATKSAIAALQAALAAEHAAVYGYGVVGAMLSGTARTSAYADWLTHQQDRDTLEAMITKLGGTPVAASPAYELPFPVTDASTAKKLAAHLEDGVTRSYLAAVAVQDHTIRGYAALAMQAPAIRAATWRGKTEAFPGMPGS